MTYGVTTLYGGPTFGGLAGAISIASAWATSTRSIQVNTDSAAAAVDSFNAGDALNPATWLVMRLDASVDLTPIFVRHLGGGTAFEVTTLEEMGSAMVTHQIGSTTLRSAPGALITSPYAAQFPGVTTSLDRVDLARRRPMIRDFANPYRGNDLTGDVVSAIQTAGGNYAGEVDAAVTRKVIIRCITTERGSIRHLPGFGIGLRSKQLLPAGGDRETLRTEIEAQVKRLRGVVKVRAAVDVFSRGVVRVQVLARLTGAQLTVAVQRDTSGRFLEL